MNKERHLKRMNHDKESNVYVENVTINTNGLQDLGGCLSIGKLAGLMRFWLLHNFVYNNR
jgi:hypothetical protein